VPVHLDNSPTGRGDLLSIILGEQTKRKSNRHARRNDDSWEDDYDKHEQWLLLIIARTNILVQAILSDGRRAQVIKSIYV
jgi:hypothetical protein